MKLLESGEMYLETIFILSSQKSAVRAIDIGEYMGFSKPSVSRAMGLLKDGGFIEVNRDGFIYLTDAGKEIAQKIYGRHTLLTEFLKSIGVDDETASADACKIEHDVSDITMDAIRKHYEEIQKKSESK